MIDESFDIQAIGHVGLDERGSIAATGLLDGLRALGLTPAVDHDRAPSATNWRAMPKRESSS